MNKMRSGENLQQPDDRPNLPTYATSPAPPSVPTATVLQEEQEKALQLVKGFVSSIDINRGTIVADIAQALADGREAAHKAGMAACPQCAGKRRVNELFNRKWPDGVVSVAEIEDAFYGRATPAAPEPRA